MSNGQENSQNHFNSLFSPTDEGRRPHPQTPSLSQSSFREMQKQEETAWYLKIQWIFVFLAVPLLILGFFIKSYLFPGTTQVASTDQIIKTVPNPPVSAATSEDPCASSSTSEGHDKCTISQLRAQIARNNQIKRLPVPSQKLPTPKNVAKLKSIPVASKPQVLVKYVPKPVERTRIVYRDRPAPEPIQQFTPPSPVAFTPSRTLSPEEVYKNLGDRVVIEGGSSDTALSPTATNAIYNSNPNESSPYPVAIENDLAPDTEGSPSDAVNGLSMTSQGVKSMSYSLPLGSVAKARFQQEISWDTGKTPETPVFLTLETTFKDRQGNQIGTKGAYLTGKIASTTQGCGYTVEVTDIDHASLPSGALVATDHAKYRRSGGASLGQRIASGLLGVGSQYAVSQNGVDNLGIAAGANVVGSLIDGGQSSLASQSAPLPTTCHISEGKKVNLLVSSEIN